MNEIFSIEGIGAALAAHTPKTDPSDRAQRNASVALVISHRPMGELAVLFMQRAVHPKDPWSGHMSLPGGGVEEQDTSLMHAAMRETLEEVGLALGEEHYIGRLHDQYGQRLKAWDMAVSPFVFYCPDPPPLVHNEEVADTVWVPLSYMRDPENIALYPFEMGGEQHDFPSFQYRDYTIWGMTYRMLRDFYAVLAVELPGDWDSE